MKFTAAIHHLRRAIDDVEQSQIMATDRIKGTVRELRDAIKCLQSSHALPPGNGVRAIFFERLVQLDQYDAAHDAAHDRGELAALAMHLLAFTLAGLVHASDRQAFEQGRCAALADARPWAKKLYAKHGDDPEQLLAIAGALLAAEIDRRRAGISSPIPTGTEGGQR